MCIVYLRINPLCSGLCFFFCWRFSRNIFPQHFPRPVVFSGHCGPDHLWRARRNTPDKCSARPDPRSRGQPNNARACFFPPPFPAADNSRQNRSSSRSPAVAFIMMLWYCCINCYWLLLGQSIVSRGSLELTWRPLQYGAPAHNSGGGLLPSHWVMNLVCYRLLPFATVWPTPAYNVYQQYHQYHQQSKQTNKQTVKIFSSSYTSNNLYISSTHFNFLTPVYFHPSSSL